MFKGSEYEESGADVKDMEIADSVDASKCDCQTAGVRCNCLDDWDT